MAGARRKPGAMAPFVDGYRDWLLNRGYSPLTVVRSLIALGHLGRWMQQNGIGVDRLDDAAICAFVAGQVRTCAGRLPLASVTPLLTYLRAEGVVSPEPPAAMTAIDQLIGATARGCPSSVVLLRRRCGARSRSPDDFSGASATSRRESV